MNKIELIRLFKRLQNELYNCTEENPCCRDEDEHNKKLGKLCETSIRLKKLGVDIDKLMRTEI